MPHPRVGVEKVIAILGDINRPVDILRPRERLHRVERLPKRDHQEFRHSAGDGVEDDAWHHSCRAPGDRPLRALFGCVAEASASDARVIPCQRRAMRDGHGGSIRVMGGRVRVLQLPQLTPALILLAFGGIRVFMTTEPKVKPINIAPL